MALYRMYVDESGSPGFNNRTAAGDRYFSVTGVIVERGYHSTKLTPALVDLKRQHFHYDPDCPPILHRSDLVSKSGEFGCLKDQMKGRAFWSDVAAFLREHEYRLVTAVIDKSHHKAMYQASAWEPYRYCFKAVLQRYLMFLGRSNQGDVLVESRGKREDRDLAAAYTAMYCGGEFYFPASEVQRKFTSKHLKVQPKAANVAGLQLADLVAQDIRSEILHEKVGLAAPSGLCKLILDAVRSKHRGVWPCWGLGRVWIGP